jgi:hypothetical protein
MNRQVGPSIVCSVLIVFFFAVAFFPRGSPHSNTDRTHTVGPADRAVSGSARSAVESGRSAGRIEQPNLVASNAGSGADSAPAVAQAGHSRATIRRAARSSGTAPAAERDEHAIKGTAPSARQSLSAMTVVEENETMADVSLRVYGRTDQAEALWRANRDALPRVDTPLSTGMVLRTPRTR